MDWVFLMVQLLLALLLQICLTTQMWLIINYIKSKPLLLTSLNDALNLDLAYFYACDVFTAFAIHCVLVVEIEVPHALALLLSHFLDFCVVGLALYPSVGVVIQYAHVRLRTPELFEDLSHEFVRRVISATITILSLSLALYNLWTGSHNGLYFTMMRAEPTLTNGPIVVFLLGISSIVINVILRTVIFMERRRGDNEIPDGPQTATSPVGATSELRLSKYMVIGLVLGSLSFCILLVYTNIRMDAHVIGRTVLLFVLCVVIPFVIIVKDRKMRAFALKRLAALSPALRSNKISPAPNEVA